MTLFSTIILLHVINAKAACAGKVSLETWSNSPKSAVTPSFYPGKHSTGAS